MRYVFPTTHLVRYAFPTHVNDLVMDRAEATAAEAFLVVLEPGQAPPLHVHHDTEQLFYLIAGRGTLTIQRDTTETFPVAPGDLVRIPPSTYHSIRAEGEDTMCYLSIDCFPGGCPGAEPTWDAHVQVLCREQGWDYATVRRPPAHER